MRIEIFSRLGLLGKRWYFRVRAANGKVIASSEGYHNRKDARSTAASLRDNLATAGIFCAQPCEGDK